MVSPGGAVGAGEGDGRAEPQGPAEILDAILSSGQPQASEQTTDNTFQLDCTRRKEAANHGGQWEVGYAVSDGEAGCSQVRGRGGEGWS